MNGSLRAPIITWRLNVSASQTRSVIVNQKNIEDQTNTTMHYNVAWFKC